MLAPIFMGHHLGCTCYAGVVVRGESVLRMLCWRRTLLAAGILVVSLSLIGMHQLSINHALATAESTSLTAVDTRATHHHVDRVHQSESATPASVMDDAMAGDCAGCGRHAMLVTSCLLALTLLVLSRRLRPPNWRPVPVFLTRPPNPIVSSLGRPRPPLSLVELSVRRT